MTPLPKRLHGSTRSAAWLNQLRQCVAERTVQFSSNVKCIHQVNGFTIEVPKQAKAEAAEAVEVTRYLVMAAYADYLACRKINETTDVHIAKPWQLRKSTYNGQTIGGVLYTYTSAEIRTLSWTESGMILTVTEEMDPSYGVGTYIYAAKLADDTEIKDSENKPIEWIDLNVDARHWRPSYRTFLLCQDNLLYRAKFAAGVAVRVP